jgi:hypothetical protein
MVIGTFPARRRKVNLDKVEKMEKTEHGEA